MRHRAPVGDPLWWRVLKIVFLAIGVFLIMWGMGWSPWT